jgi:hypothetical protein
VGDTTLGGAARRVFAPAEVRDLAHARRDARRRRSWQEADELLARIEAAGWKVVDRGTDFALEPLVPPDVVVDGLRLHGGSASVPSLLDEPAAFRRSVVVVDAAAGDGRPRPALPAGTVLVVGGTTDAEPPSGGELIRLLPATSGAGLVTGGLRRAVGEVIVLAWAPTPLPEPLLDELEAALEDPSVGCAGTIGVRTSDLRDLEPVTHGEADVLLAGAIAFRRADLVARLPVDERIGSSDRVAAWLSLRLREPEDPWAGGTFRRALVVGGDEGTVAARIGELAADRSARRDHYRLLDRFGRSADLLRGPR